MFSCQLELLRGFWEGDNIVVSASDKTRRAGGGAGRRKDYYFKKSLCCYKGRAYRAAKGAKDKTFGPSGLADGQRAMDVRQKKAKKNGRFAWKHMLASQKKAQPMPDSRPSKRAKKNPVSADTSSSQPTTLTPRPYRASTTKAVDAEERCSFRVTVCIGVPRDSEDGKDIWIMQVNNTNHTWHCPHNCEEQGWPVRLKEDKELGLAVQVCFMLTRGSSCIQLLQLPRHINCCSHI